jgi:hypothetical protein
MVRAYHTLALNGRIVTRQKDDFFGANVGYLTETAVSVGRPKDG